MKIIQCMQDDYRPSICGNAFVVESFHNMIATEFDKDIVVVWEKDRPDHEIVDGVEVYNFRGIRRPEIARHIADLCEPGDIVIFHAHDCQVAQAFAKISLPVTRILVQHFFTKKLRDWYKHYHCTVVFQRWHYQYYNDVLGIPKHKLFLSPPPLDFRNVYTTPTPMDERIPRSIVYAGRVNVYKGCHMLIPYLNELDVSYTIVGPQNNDFYMDRIVNMARHYKVSDRLKIMDPVPQDELAGILNQHQIFVLPSSSDCFSLVLREAMACGCTCAALKQVRSYDWTQGYAYLAGSIRDMAGYIKWVLQNPKRFVDTYTFAKNVFDFEILAPRFCDFLRKVSECQCTTT